MADPALRCRGAAPILIGREHSRIEEVQQQIVDAIGHAREGRFYDPMKDVEIAKLAQSAAAGDDRLKPIVTLLTKLDARLDAVASDVSLMRSPALDGYIGTIEPSTYSTVSPSLRATMDKLLRTAGPIERAYRRYPGSVAPSFKVGDPPPTLEDLGLEPSDDDK